MSKKLSRFIAGIMLACMVAGSIPAQAAYGATANAENEEGAAMALPEDVQDTEEVAESNELSDEDLSSKGAEVESQQPEEKSTEEIITTPAADVAVESSGVEEENEINFVYIESPYLETPGTQRIVFSFEQQIMGTDVVTLTVENEMGSREEWELSLGAAELSLWDPAMRFVVEPGDFALSLEEGGKVYATGTLTVTS